MLLLIENGEVYAPEPLGRQSILIGGAKLLKIGTVDRRSLDRLGVDIDVIDATGCVITPGLIDPHEHLLGGSGERGFSSQTPPITLGEIAEGGITTVVGCLGVDTTMKTLPGLLACAKGLAEQGLTAHLWTGGYNVPPTTMLTSVREDILFIAEVIGAGEIAISDDRSTDPRPDELARLVNDAYCGGLLSRKAGLTHFHVGERPRRLQLLHTLIDGYDTPPACLYPTHVGRNEALLRDAIVLANRGAAVDIDTTDKQLARWLRLYLDNGGNPDRLTISTDASITSPRNLLEQVRACVNEHGLALERILPLATANPAHILKLAGKGRLAAGADADVLVLEPRSLALRDVIARGHCMVRDGTRLVQEEFLRDSDRNANLIGKQQPAPAR